MNYMSLVDEYEKECVVDKGEKVSREWRAVREGFAAWLDKRAAQHRVQSDGCHKCGKSNGEHTAWCNNQLWTSTTRR